MPLTPELTPRRQRILRHIIEEYVATAQPVASDLIARKYEPDVSSATVRNEMAVLEEADLIAHPHTSAGRVPTERGYRLLVEQLIEHEPGVPAAEQRAIRQQLSQAMGDPDELAHLASSILARSLRSAAVASPPATRRSRLRRLELVPLADDTLLVTLLLQSGAVRQVVHHVEQPIERSELTRLSNQLSDTLANRTAGQVRRGLGKLQGHAHTVASVAARMLQQNDEQVAAAIYYEGLTQLLSQPEFAQSQKLRPILEVLEQQPLLARFLAESLANPGVQVVIGTENRLEQMRETALVLTRYGTPDEVGGIVGVMGPTRLAYWRAVPLVRVMADLMAAVAQSPS
jgi:heat-inducible transcriptional repressor